MATSSEGFVDFDPNWDSNTNSSWENLLLECGNHLHFGHWELFRALAMTITLQPDHPDAKARVLDMVKNVYQHPEIFGAGLSTKCTENPCDIFWLCAQFYQEISDNKDEADRLLKDAGFKQILGVIWDDSCKHYIKEIYSIFQAYQAGERLTNPLLTDGCKKFFIDLFKAKSDVAVNVFEPLLRLEKAKFGCHNVELLLCLCESLDKCLTELEFASGPTFQSELADSAVLKESVYTLLPLCESFGYPYIPTHDIIHEEDERSSSSGENAETVAFNINIDKALVRIWQLCERGVLNRRAVFFALLSHKDLWMVKRMCRLEDKAKNRLEQHNSNLSAETFLRLVYSRSGNLNIKELFLYSFVNRSHFLECLINSCTELIRSGQPLLACGILRDPVLCRLKPLILLLSWNKVKMVPDVVKFIEAFESLYSVSTVTDPDLDLACRRLVCKAKLLLWALNNPCSKKHKTTERDIADLLSNLQKCSSLHILSRCMHIEHIDRQELDAILNTWTSSLDIDDLQAEINGTEKTELDTQLSLERIHDHMVLLGYHILFDFVQIVQSGIKLDQLIIECRSSWNIEETNTSSPQSEENSTQASAEDSLAEFYSLCIVEPLGALRQKISNLYPLTYRVEILENAFSLLFLTHQNATTESSTVCSSDSSDEGHEGEDKISHGSNIAKSKATTVLKDSNAKKPVKHCRGRSDSKFRGSRGILGSHDAHPSSENASSRSAGSTSSSLTRIGFLCNQFVVRDFLDCLKQCIFEAVSLNKGQASPEPNLIDVVLSSVDKITLPRRLSSLSRYVAEAQWRFQVVADDWLPKGFGEFPARNVIEELNLNDDWSCQFYEEQNSDDDEEEIKAISTQAATAVNQELPSDTRRKISAHRKLSRCTGNPFADAYSAKGIISKMLAAHESLLNICLNQNDLAKAGQVIKLFGMEHTCMAADTAFALDYQKAVQQLIRLTSSSSSLRPSLRGTHHRSSTWDSIVKAAQSGMDAASKETFIADELLASHKVPGVAEVEKPEIKSQLANWLPDLIDWRAFVRSDLALVACAKAHACRNLLEASYVALCGNSCLIPPPRTIRSKFSNQPPGVLGFIKEMLELISSELDPLDTNEISGAKQPAIRDILLQALHPLSLKAHQKSKYTWKRVNKVVNQLHAYLEDEQKINDEFSPMASSSPNYKQKQRSFSHHPSHDAYRKLMKLASVLRSSLEENSQTKMKNEHKSPAYLFSLFDYAKNLATVLPKLESEQPLFHGSYFSTFQQSPVSILEQLVFGKSGSPKDLEGFAKNLNLDLLQIIIQRSCPKIPVTGESSVDLKNTSSSGPSFDLASQAKAEGNATVTETTISTKSMETNEHPAISEELLSYVEEKCWLAAVLIRALGYVIISANELNGVETAHGDPVILHPVLHRFLERRRQFDSTLSSDAALVLYPRACFKTIVSNLENYVQQENWTDALDYMNCWECQNPACETQFNSFRNLVLAKLSQQAYLESKNEGFPPWTYVMQIKDANFKAKMVLEQYGSWPADEAISALNDCISCESLQKEFGEDLKLCLQKVKIYNTIARYIASEVMRVDIGEAATWQDVAIAANSSISTLIDCLLSAKKYSVIVDLSKLHEFPAEKQGIVSNCSMLALLEGPVMNPTALQQALAVASLPQQRYLISMHILDIICTSSENSSLLLCILETVDLNDVMGFERLQFFRKKIGIKIVLCLPVEERSDYLDLITHPHIMIEQLLINIKIETLQHAFQVIRDDLKQFTTDALLSFDAINKLLEVYATKAMDFRVAQTSVSDISRNIIGISVEKVVKKPAKFLVPQKVPTKQQWIPDASVMECMVCSVEQFSMFNRRHHCRRCGRVCCSMCSQWRKKVWGYEDVLVRVCDDCFSADSAMSSSEYAPSLTSDSLEKRLKARFGGSLDSTGNSGQEYSPATESQRENSENVAWKLSLDAAHNLTAREEFSYEQAPSISLCLSICDLHWNQRRSGLKLLSFATTLFKFLQPISPGVVNPEIDYRMIITMLKSVLLSAKVKFSKAFDNFAVTCCDVYLGIADLLNLLVLENCKHLIPAEDLTKDNISSFPYRRLRELLMKEERWNLALEISTKGGLDVLGVWVAWGMVCLQIGHYSAAREKFSHCLQKDLNKRTQSDTLLTRILHQLESSTITGFNETAVTASLSKLKSIKTMGSVQNLPVQESSQPKLNPTIREECLYYIKTYGNHASMLSFYVRHNEWESGIRTVFEDMTCPAAVFVEDLIMPSLRSACFSQVKFAMKQLDPSLEVWAKYFEALGRHLERNGLVHVLYDLQIFLKDYLRAAMTCIQFYQHGANDYSDLYDRLEHLQQAKQHLESFKQKHVNAKSSKKIGLVLPMKDVEKYLRAIELQVDVTKFLHEKSELCETLLEMSSAKFDTSSIGSVSPSKSAIGESDLDFCSISLPTIFGNAAARAHVVAMVVLCGAVIMEGFLLAVRIIQEYHLHTANVYSLIAKKLVQQQRLADLSPFLNCLKRIGGQNDALCDRVVLKTIAFSIEQGCENRDVELLIRLLVEDKSKIDALIQCGKLKSAYLLAVKEDSLESVRKILEEAQRMGQMSVKSICEKWLNLKQKNLK